MGKRKLLATGLAVVVLAAGTVSADVKMQDKSRVQFGGALGKMFNLFGGKMARQGITSTTAIKGDRLLSRSGETGQLIDLGEEKVYTIDFKKKEYTVATFAEIRRQMQEMMERAKQQQARAQADARKAEQKGEKPPEMQIDVDVKETGEKKAINGFDTRQVITTVTVREKGKTLDQSGGLVLTTDSWVAPKIPAMSEVADFYVRYYKKLDVAGSSGAPMEQMAAAMAMYPALKDALAKARTEGAKFDGTPISSVMNVAAVAGAGQAAQAEREEQQEKPAGIGGLGGMFARKIMKKKKTDEADAEGGDPAQDRANIVRMTNEVLSVDPTVQAEDVALPAGFKQKG